jgi:hypothetical protein
MAEVSTGFGGFSGFGGSGVPAYDWRTPTGATLFFFVLNDKNINVSGGPERHPFQYALFCFPLFTPKKSMPSGDRLLFRAPDYPPNLLNPPNPVETSVIDASRRDRRIGRAPVPSLTCTLRGVLFDLSVHPVQAAF